MKLDKGGGVTQAVSVSGSTREPDKEKKAEEKESKYMIYTMCLLPPPPPPPKLSMRYMLCVFVSIYFYRCITHILHLYVV